MKTEICARALIREVEKIIVGKHDTIELIITAALSGGHVLPEDLQESGKTTLVRSLALALGCQYKRILFTPDLLPSDVIGMTVFNQKTSDFQLNLGPVHTNLLLADKINPVASPELLRELREEIHQVYMDDSIKTYLVELVHRTREHKALKSGASPRTSRSLYQGSKTLAAIQSRDYVTPEDIWRLTIPILSHRIQLTGEARYSGRTTVEVLEEILEAVPIPPYKENLFHE